MALTLKLDAFDFSPYMRLQPGEGFDPTQNPVEPQFGESAAGEGNPLLGFSQANRLMTWPLALTPAKSGGTYANTKAGLHQLIRDVNFTAQRAGRVEWKDDGATASTFFDVVAVKFEPESNYWRATHEWVLGALKVWVKPYGDTGTLVLTGTAAGTGVAVAATVGNVDGDVGAQVRAIVTVGSNPLRDGRIVGLAAVGASYTWDVPLSQATWPQGSLYGASGAPGSQFIGQELPFGSVFLNAEPAADGFVKVARIALSPASQYIGRNRVMLVAQNGGIYGLELRLQRDGGAVIGGGHATGLPGRGWGTVDAGVLAVASGAPAATVTLNVLARFGAPPQATPAFSAPFLNTKFAVWTNPPVGIGRILVLPEESAVLAIDANRTLLAGDTLINHHHTLATVTPLASLSDSLGNPWLSAAALGATSLRAVPSSNAGAGEAYAYSLGSGLVSEGANILSPTGANLKVEASFDGFVAQSPTYGASRALFVGKALGEPGYYAVRVHVADMPSARIALALVHGSSALTPATVLACQGFSLGGSQSQLANILGGAGYLTFRNRGPQITGEFNAGYAGSLISMSVSVNASTAGAHPGRAGRAFVAESWTARDSTPQGNSPALTGIRVTETPSSAAPADKYVFDDVANTVYSLTSASAFRVPLDSQQVGQMPRPAPSGHAKLVGFSLPLDNDPGNDLIALEVRVRSRFKYGVP